jgi:hypothetical protein
MTFDLSQFKQLLLAVRREFPQDVILLSHLGMTLRRQEPPFDPRAYGVEKLIDLLRQVPDVGSIVNEDSAGTAKFVFAGKPLADSAEAEVLLRPDIWRAVTDFRPHTDPYFLDLSNLSIQRASDDREGLLTSEPERFITLPTIDAEFQKGLARKLVNEQRPELSSRLEERLAEQRWYSATTELFRASALDEAWSRVRVKELGKVVTDWAVQHGVDPEKITYRPQRKATSQSISTGSYAPPARREAPAPLMEPRNADDLRDLIHDAIDLMSPPELAALPIPPAYLMMATLRKLRKGAQ